MLNAVATVGLPPAQAVFAGFHSALSLADLPFNPLRLFFLVGWVYLCLYFVQRVNFSPLVPKSYRTVANVVTLFTGPFLLLALIFIDTAQRARRTGNSLLSPDFFDPGPHQSSHGVVRFFDVLKQQIRRTTTTIRSFRLSSDEEEDAAIRLLDSSGRSIDELCGHGDMKRQDARILGLTEATIGDALDRRASDILIDPKDESSYSIRLRIDGSLRMVKELDVETCRALINSIKAVSGMDISERRRPQDGGFMARRSSTTASFRVASAGAMRGEKLSIRILNKDAGTFTLAQMGLPEKQRAVIHEAIRKPSGMIVVCGPTGSGKTTTLYAMLNEIDRFTRNVITVEDPIEAELPEASQIEVNPRADITFASTLRSVLRQDPDVICVGEIRDEETAEIALRAAQTGHLVTATIHCDSNPTAIVRLLDLGVSPLLLSAGLSLLVSQRLLRCLCERCKAPARLSDSQIDGFRKNRIDHTRVFTAVGCKDCDRTGYSGRMAICDLMVVDRAMKAEIARDGTGTAAPDSPLAGSSLIDRFRTEKGQKGLSALRKAGLKKVIEGVTSLDELKRVVG